MTTADELAIRRTMAVYCLALDDGDFAGCVDQFTPNGSLSFGDEVASGSMGLLAFFERTQPPERRGKHVSANPVFDIHGDRAEVVSDFVFLRFSKGALKLEAAGRYRDALVRSGERWLFERRAIELLRPPS